PRQSYSNEAAVRLQAKLDEEERQRIAMVQEVDRSSKHGRKITKINQDPGISLVQNDVEIQGRYGHDTKINDVSTSITTASINITTVEPITTVSTPITTAGVSVGIAKLSTPPTTTTTIIEDKDLTISQNLMKIRNETVHEERGDIVERAATIAASLDAEQDSCTISRTQSTTIPKELFLRELVQSEVDRAVPELAARSSKRDAEKALDQGGSKRKYWKIIRVRNHTKVHHLFDDMLKDFDKDDLVMLWSLVKEKFNSTEPTDDKESKIWVELKRLFKPDTDDEEENKHLHAGGKGVSIVKGNSYIDAGRKALYG
nr:hypothetical protein [Tanacetum cinerariifolium]